HAILGVDASTSSTWEIKIGLVQDQLEPIAAQHNAALDRISRVKYLKLISDHLNALKLKKMGMPIKSTRSGCQTPRAIFPS
ncbi:MAG: hypothetical protein N3B12_09515, partial [Armatimonadetes bacterium]|nr:hypothetical protein [Armatimonadota bacterium]